MCAALGAPKVVPGVVSLAPTFNSLAHWHPHLHVVVTDGGFRRDGSFVAQTAHDAAVLAEAWRSAVLSLFVRQDWLEEDAATSMLAWPHSGFSAYVGPAISAEDRAAVLRVARYGARDPVAESRLRYDEVYDVTGRRVRSLEAKSYDAGPHHVVWDGRSDNGALVRPGLYLWRMRLDGHRVAAAKAMMLE